MMRQWFHRCYRPSALVLFGAAMALLTSGCLWGVVRDARTGAPVAGAHVLFSCPCRTPTDNPWDSECSGGGRVGVGWQATTDANGIYVIDTLPLVSDCPPSSFWAGSMFTYKVGYRSADYSPLFDYIDNPNASLDDLHSFWEVQNFELVPARWGEVELVSFDISRSRVTHEAKYHVSVQAIPPSPVAGGCSIDGTGYIVSSDPTPIELEDPLGCVFEGDEVEVSVTLMLVIPHSTEQESTASFNWTVPEGETDWLTVTLDSADAAGPDDPDLEFTATVRYRAVTAETTLVHEP
jgi:hypothetical protein